MTLLTGQPEDGDARGSGEAEDSGQADVQVLQRRAAAQTHAVDEHGFYPETVSEYLWARDVAGFAPTTLEKRNGTHPFRYLTLCQMISGTLA
ncbi:hypothetical protein [Streptomyces sp. NPDC005336]|uniref:hypothetical protein n=1 Tax=Streptomyces sp. NPDC005336 TaxID=3157035 RepID=UPI0033B34EAD